MDIQETYVTDALAYHAQAPAGKLRICPTKPLHTQQDLALAYSPGVSAPSEAIAKDKRKIYEYTAKGNLVGIVSDGTAVLGLGNVGPEAAKPVMEGKAVLLKKFAGIDAFDIELATQSPTEVIQAITAIAPTFGAINLEDIKAPACFEIEETLRERLQIPIMHDDQHGTAIVVAAALRNALTLAHKDIRHARVVMHGAGAGAIACAKLLLALGVAPTHMTLCDSQGVIRKDRPTLHPSKAAFATDRPIHTLQEAIPDQDVFIGLSKADVLTQAQVRSMAKQPIIFALANPNPEISYEAAKAARPDVIIATGRSDYPNQINNVLSFPYIFRGALDVQATQINEAMKLAAVEALAELAQQPVPASVEQAYGQQGLSFGEAYLLPKPFDPRLLALVSTAVAQAAIHTGVAMQPIQDWTAYLERLARLVTDGETLQR
ncbi:MAG: malic enzyme-like NAD(P)-binding protein [Bacteroidota bacterium]